MKFVYFCGSLQPKDAEAAAHFAQMEEGEELKFIVTEKTRTPKQNKSLWTYCGKLAEALDAGGFDQRTFPFREGLRIPFTKTSVMELFWRPIQLAMLGKESTREPTTVELQSVYKAVDRAIAERTGVRVEWPSKESLAQERQVV